MLSEYADAKKNLMAAIEQSDEQLNRVTTIYALLETEDPGWPFDLRLISRQGLLDEELRVMNERLFDKAFLDFGYREIRTEDNLEGVVYAPLEDMMSDNSCIGVAPVSQFDESVAKAYMARGAEDDEVSEDPSRMRFNFFLRLVREFVMGFDEPQVMTAGELDRISGLIFKYDPDGQGGQSCVVAFQRVQRMWVQKRSSYLLFTDEGAEPSPFAGQSLKLGNSFDFAICSGQVFFRNLRALEILFSFTELLAQQAKDYADTLEPIVADFEKLDERIEASRSVANKLIKLQKEGSAVAELSVEELQARVSRVAYYSGKIKFNEQGRVMLTTNTEVNDFLRLLNDNMLVSPVTSERYEVRSKKRLTADDVI